MSSGTGGSVMASKRTILPGFDNGTRNGHLLGCHHCWRRDPDENQVIMCILGVKDHCMVTFHDPCVEGGVTRASWPGSQICAQSVREWRCWQGVSGWGCRRRDGVLLHVRLTTERVGISRTDVLACTADQLLACSWDLTVTKRPCEDSFSYVVRRVRHPSDVSSVISHSWGEK